MENNYNRDEQLRDANASKTVYKEEKIVYKEDSGLGTTLAIVGVVAVLAVCGYVYHTYTPPANPADIEPAAGTSYVAPTDTTTTNPATANPATTDPSGQSPANAPADMQGPPAPSPSTAP